MRALVNIDVPDVERAIAFYRDGVGLRLARRLFAGTVAEMLGASSPIYLLEKADGSPPCGACAGTRDYARHWTPVHLDFVVEDLEAAIRHAEAAGAQLESGPLDFAWGRQATLSDPFGHGLCFIAWRGQPYAGAD